MTFLPPCNRLPVVYYSVTEVRGIDYRTGYISRLLYLMFDMMRSLHTQFARGEVGLDPMML